MDEKKKWTDWLALGVKVFAGIALYFSIAMIITAADAVIDSGKMGVGYALFAICTVFLCLQFVLTFRVTNELLRGKVTQLIPAAIKTFVGASFFLSFAVIGGFSETLLSPTVVSAGFAMTLTCVLFFVMLFLLVVYAFADVMQKFAEAATKTE